MSYTIQKSLNSYVGIGTVQSQVHESRPQRFIIEIEGQRIGCKLVGGHGQTAGEGSLVGIRGRLMIEPRGMYLEAHELNVLRQDPKVDPEPAPGPGRMPEKPSYQDLASGSLAMGRKFLQALRNLAAGKCTHDEFLTASKAYTSAIRATVYASQGRVAP